MPSPNTIEKTAVLLKATFTIIPEEYAPIKEKVFRETTAKVTIPGFRPGKAPDALLRERVGEGYLMEETARSAIEDAYPELIKKEEVRPVGSPRIAITKCVSGNPLEFTIEVDIYPPITLPDYKKIAQKIFSEQKENLTATDDEVEKALLEIKKYRENTEIKGMETKTEIHLDDAFAQSLGNFKDLADLKEKMRENIIFEKKQKEKIDARKSALAKIIKETNIPLPPSLIDAETNGMLAELKERATQSGLAFADYLRHSKKTEDEIMKELRTSAEARVREEFIVHEIAEKESLHPTNEEIEANTRSFLSARPDVPLGGARRYVSEVLLHEKVHQLLEKKEEKENNIKENK